MKKRVLLLCCAAAFFCVLLSACKHAPISSETASNKTVLSALLADFAEIPKNKEQSALVSAYDAVLQNENATQKDVDIAVSALKTLKEQILASAVPFIDGALEECARAALSRSDAEPLTVADCLSLETLDCSRDPDDPARDPVRMTFDLKYFPRLTALYLEGNALTELTGLSYLKNLTTLSLSPESGRRLSYTLLQSLPLTSLTVRGAEFDAFSELPSLPSVTELTLIRCSCPDFSGIAAAYPALKTLRLSRVSVSDPSALRACDALQTLEMTDTDAADLSFLGGMSGLRSLSLVGCKDPDLRSLSAAQLNTLDLSDCGIDDVSWLSALSGLAALDLSGNLLTEFVLPDGVRALTTLDLSDNRLTSFSLPQGANGFGLKVLDLSGNLLTEADLSDCAELITLDLSDNRLAGCDLRLDALTGLDLSENPLLGASLRLPMLRTLTLSSAAVLTTETFSLYAPQISSFFSEDARFDSFAFLRGCSELRAVNADVSDADAASLRGFSSVTDLSLIGADEDIFAVLAELSSLKRLVLTRGTFSAASLSALPALESLQLIHCASLSDLSGVHDLPSLREYAVVSARCAEPAVSSFPALESLSLERSGVRTLAGVTDLPQLTRLSLVGNGLTSVDAVGYPSLEFVDLSNNRITSYAACSFDMVIGTIDLRGNPLETSSDLGTATLEVLTD